MDDFAHLHVHTEYSQLDGAARLKPLAQRAAELGMSALGMTDHGNLNGAYDFHRQTTAAGVKPIIGIEAYIAPGSRHHTQPVFWGAPGNKRASDADSEGGDVSGGGAYLHMTMLAENAEGLRNLFRLSTEASVSGFYRKPRLDAELIAEHASGIIATTGCPGGEVQTRLRLGQFDEAVEAAGKWQDIFGQDNFFLELMDHGLKIETQVRQGLLEVAKRVGLKPLATNDSHYVKPEDADTHDTLLCVGIGKNKADTDRFRFDGNGYYIKSGDEMRRLWDGQVPGACDNTLLIAERVESYDEVFAPRDLMPRFPVPEGHTQDSWLREETWRGLHFRYGDPLSAEIVERAEYELEVISKMGFSAYFLVVADICRHARESGIAVGPGRGSAAGSIIAYATRITELDPMLHGLMFERFLNPDRVSPPDADLDFDDRRRGDVVRYVTEKYGSEHVSMIITLGTLKAKAAIKDAARVLGSPYALGEKLSKMVPAATQGNEPPLAAMDDENHPRYAEFQPMRDLISADPEAHAVLAAARGLEGFIRSTGVHPAGVLVSDQPLIEILPLSMRQNDGAMIAGFTYPQAENMGLLKIDFLGLRNLTIMGDAVRAVKERLGIEVDLHSLPLDDRKTYELMARGGTRGTFQLDGSGMRSLLKMMKPDKFEDISAAGALYRPGPMGADSHTNYALRKNGKQAVTPIHRELEEPLADILGETYGLIVYQEQVMAIAQKVAGYSLAQADLLRRAMGKKKKEELDKQFVSFEAGMKANGYSSEAVRTLWDLLVPFSDYAFNKCATGDTLVTRLGRGSRDWPQTLRNLANRIHGREDYDGNGCRYCYEDRPITVRTRECKACKSWRAKWRMDGGMNAAGRVGDRILPVKITDVFRQGVKPVWKMTLANGMSLTSTANHRHLTPQGWKRLDQLAIGEGVSTMADGEWGIASPRTDHVGEGKSWAQKHGWQIHGRYAQLMRNTATLAPECAHCGSFKEGMERAHLDGNPLNNAQGNLAYLCNSCHKRHDYANGGRTKMWRKGRAIESSPIVSIEYVGEEMTYDVTVDSEDHSWVANGGIVTHNSHSAAYGLLAYWTTYLKAHYPADYMAAVLTGNGDSKDSKAVYLAECRHMGIKVLPPDVNSSGLDFTAVSDTEIRFGLSAVRNIGTGAAEAIVAGRRNRPYEDLGDFLNRVPPAACTKRVVDSLAKAGGFDSLGHSRRGLCLIHESAVEQASKTAKVAATGQSLLFEEETAEVTVPDLEWDKVDKLQFEREMLGLYVSDHPLSGLEEVLKRNRGISIAEVLAEPRDEAKVRLCGMLTSVEHKVSKANNPWALAVLEDLDASVEVVFFGKTYQAYKDSLAKDTVVSVGGKVQIRPDGSVNVVGDGISQIEVLDANLPLAIHLDEVDLTPEVVKELGRILDDYPGEVEVQVYVRRGDDKTIICALPDRRVNPTTEFQSEIKGLLGADSLWR